MSFLDFVLERLPPPPARVLEVGCGPDGGVTPDLVAAGYDLLAIDPRAPQGPPFRPIALEELEEPRSFDAVVASRVLHHVTPLAPAVEKLARLAPLLLLDEFAPERIGPDEREWYEGQHRLLVASGAEPPGPPDLTRWAAAHAGLHPSDMLLHELERSFEPAYLEWRPYLYRWLAGPASEALERTLVDADALRAIGYRYAGRRA